MRKGNLFILASGLGALALGLVSGEVLALPTSTAGTAATLPYTQPAAATYTIPISIPWGQTADLLLGIGRDDQSPYAVLKVMFTNANTTYGYGGTTYWTGSMKLTYRPLWDVDLIPTLPATSTVSYCDVHWTAVHAFADSAQHLREDFYLLSNSGASASALNPYPKLFTCWLNPNTIGGGGITDSEFYKFSMEY